MSENLYGARVALKYGDNQADIFRLDVLEKNGLGRIDRLPVSIKVLLEQALRNFDTFQVTEEDIRNLSKWNAKSLADKEIPFKPTRVILQDFTGVPSVVDLASLRTSMEKMGRDPSVINPKVPVNLVVDHSVQVDKAGSASALSENMKIEFERNQERYQFLKWGQQAFDNFHVCPPGAGIIHQVNLEYIAQVVQLRDGFMFPDTCVGTDSHTTMINGIGVIGWGVGGIEAESVMLGQPLYMKIPEVIGFKFCGELPIGITATDLVLRIVQILREKGVVEKFVEFFGSGLSNLSLADRATIANMAPEYGATMGFFPVDSESLNYLRNTGRKEEVVQRVEVYYKEQGMFRTDMSPDPEYTSIVELDLSTIVPSLSGPKRPQDRINLSDMKSSFKKDLQAPAKQRGFELHDSEISKTVKIEGMNAELKQGSVVIAAITSCINTSNPSVLIAAGILAKNAREKGLKTKPWVKTSLAPGSRVVTDYLDQAQLTEPLEELGFNTVGYGCTTCIGNSGPLPQNIEKSIDRKNLVVSAVLSGNRNFEGRIHAKIKANYLASPPLVVAYALAGTVDFNMDVDPLGKDSDGILVYLKDLWPTNEEIASAKQVISPEMFHKRYQKVESMSDNWNQVQPQTGQDYKWNSKSTYIQNPPFFQGMSPDIHPLKEIMGAKVLLKLGDSVTTDHISPAGAFTPETPAGKYLIENGVEQMNFNSYGSRRGNDRVMTRGTFANIRIKNQLAPGTEGGFTKYKGEITTVYEASLKYKSDKTPLIVLAGAEYGTGSSRDWAAKGTFLLGIAAVVATSFERIHRSNLVGMGVLPLVFKDGKTHESLGLTGDEEYSVLGVHDDIQPRQELILKVDDREITVISRLDTAVEIEYFKNGGILHTVLRNFMNESK